MEGLAYATHRCVQGKANGVLRDVGEHGEISGNSNEVLRGAASIEDRRQVDGYNPFSRSMDYRGRGEGPSIPDYQDGRYEDGQCLPTLGGNRSPTIPLLLWESRLRQCTPDETIPLASPDATVRQMANHRPDNNSQGFGKGEQPPRDLFDGRTGLRGAVAKERDSLLGDLGYSRDTYPGSWEGREVPRGLPYSPDPYGDLGLRGERSPDDHKGRGQPITPGPSGTRVRKGVRPRRDHGEDSQRRTDGDPSVQMFPPRPQTFGGEDYLSSGSLRADPLETPRCSGTLDHRPDQELHRDRSDRSRGGISRPRSISRKNVPGSVRPRVTGGEIKLSPDLELDEKEKVHAHILQASAHYGDPLTGETREERSGRAFFDFFQPDFIREHLSQIFSYNGEGGY